MEIYTPLVGIELSQVCNLNCSHCMRGESNNSKMSIELLNKFFDEVRYIDGIVISGGEPFMHYDEIKVLIDLLKDKNVFIPTVYIATNGTIYDERIYKILEDYFENIEIYISVDKYHFESIKEIYSTNKKSNNPRLKPMTLNDIIKNIELHQSNPHFEKIYTTKKYLINMGRAKNLNVPKKDFDPLGYFYTDCIENMLLAGPTMYLDTEGYLTDGNSNYDSRNKISIGNIKENRISNLLLKNAIRIECDTIDDFIKIMNKRENDYQQYKGKRYIYKNNKIIEVNLNNKNEKKLIKK